MCVCVWGGVIPLINQVGELFLELLSGRAEKIWLSIDSWATRLAEVITAAPGWVDGRTDMCGCTWRGLWG